MPNPFSTWCDDIRTAIHAIRDAELKNLASGVHLRHNLPPKKEVERQRVSRMVELQDLLMGPALRAAEQTGWETETAMKRLAALFNAANYVSHWDECDRCCGKVTEECFFDGYVVHPEADPEHRLHKLLGEMETLLAAVIRLAGIGNQIDGGNTESTRHKDDRDSQPALDDEDLQILRALANKPLLLLTLDHIEADAFVSRKTISKRMPALLEHGLVVRPKGPKRGVQVTRRGLSILREIEARRGVSKSTR